MPTVDELYRVWMVLNEILGSLREKDVFIPDLTYADLRNSKMVLEYLRSLKEDLRSSDNADERLREEMELKILQLRDTLLIWTEQKEGKDYRIMWEERLQQAAKGDLHEETEEPHVPISDLPRDKQVSFFRIRLPDEIPVEIISELAEDCRVNISLDGDRHLQVSGKKDCVRDAMQRLGRIFYGESQLKR